MIQQARDGRVYSMPLAMYVHTCHRCGIPYGMPDAFDTRRRNDGGTFYCPNGHGEAYRETKEDRLRKRAEQLERRLRSTQDTADRWRANAEAERRSAIAYKGHLTRVRNRIAAGVCPVPGCKRSGFDRVMAHIASQHPDWLHEHPEVAADGR